MKAEANLCLCVCVSRDDLDLALQSGDWKEVREFYLTTFNSFIEINAAFKVKHTLLSSSLSNALCRSGVKCIFRDSAILAGSDGAAARHQTVLGIVVFFQIPSESVPVSLVFSFLLNLGCFSPFLSSSFSSSQREANGSFNTTEDSGLDAKFVNAVYDALLCTVSTVDPFTNICAVLWL